jgi:hypothetical protein
MLICISNGNINSNKSRNSNSNNSRSPLTTPLTMDKKIPAMWPDPGFFFAMARAVRTVVANLLTTALTSPQRVAEARSERHGLFQ